MGDTDDVEYTTIRITKAEHQQANERRKAAGMDWGDWITDERRGPDAEGVATEITAQLNIDADDAHEEIDDLGERIDDLNDRIGDIGERGRSDLSREDVEDAVRDVLAERNPPGVDIQTRDVNGGENLNQQTDPDDGDSLVKTEDGRPEECPECGDDIPEQLGGGVVCVSCGWST